MRPKREEKGLIMALVLVILTILTMFAMTMMILSTVTVETAGNIRADQEALNIAYNRYQRAQQYLIDHSCVKNDIGSENRLDTDGDTYLDLDDILATQLVTCEEVLQSSSDTLKEKFGVGRLTIKAHLKCCDNHEVERDHFLITATGGLLGVIKNVTARVEHKSFLNFARFTYGSLSYGDNATVEGEVYCGGNLSPGNGCTYKKDVYVKGSIGSASGVTWEGEKFDNYEKTISLDVDNQIADMYKEALKCGWVISQNQISGNINTGDRNCLGGSRFTGGEDTDDNLLDFSLFKNLDGSIAGQNPRYEGPNCTHNLPVNFNGIIFWDDSNGYDLHVRGTLGVDEDDGLGQPDSVAGRGKSVAILARTRNIIVDNHVLTGSNHLGRPVNIGYVVSGDGKRFIFHEFAPIRLVHKGAIMVTKTTSQCWRREGDNTAAATNAAFNTTAAADTPCNSTSADVYCTFDLDDDGTYENPNEYGWYEKKLSTDPTSGVRNGRTNMLVQWGPIITQQSGTRGMWHYHFPGQSDVKTSTASTLLQHYDPDILKYPPPFPKISNLLHLVSYTEHDE